jgi:lipoyl(octanoyl) transferase
MSPSPPAKRASSSGCSNIRRSTPLGPAPSRASCSIPVSKWWNYHGPGQRVGYVLLDLKHRARDARGFVHALEGWVIATLADFGVDGFRREGRIGIWTTDTDRREAKIGAIGVRIRRWVTMHGFSVNLAPDLSHFGGIVPCGIEEFGVTSLERLGLAVDQATWDAALLTHAGPFFSALEIPCPREAAE